MAPSFKFLPGALALGFASLLSTLYAQPPSPKNIALVNGQWLNGSTFEPRTVYSVKGLFSFNKPERLDSTIDLQGLFMVPPFADAHNHNIGTGAEELDMKAIKHFGDGGVFYVKIMGNLPMTAAAKQKLGINTPNNIDVAFAQGSMTATGGMPIFIVEKMHPGLGFNKGYTLEQLKDFRYFTIDNEKDLEEKWPRILAQKPDFIKTFLWNSGNYEKLKNDTSVFFKGLNPVLLPKIIAKAHAHNLKVSVHVTNAADFHHALVAGVDEIAHLPRYVSGAPNQPIGAEDAKLAATKGITVVTTAAASIFQGGMVKPADRPLARQHQVDDLKTLIQHGVSMAIGSDDISDNSLKEAFYLKALGLFDNATLLHMWTSVSAKAIFPERKIGALQEGYEASFLALEGNPLEDLEHVKKIRLRFKQGWLWASTQAHTP